MVRPGATCTESEGGQGTRRSVVGGWFQVDLHAVASGTPTRVGEGDGDRGRVGDQAVGARSAPGCGRPRVVDPPGGVARTEPERAVRFGPVPVVGAVADEHPLGVVVDTVEGTGAQDGHVVDADGVRAHDRDLDPVGPGLGEGDPDVFGQHLP